MSQNLCIFVENTARIHEGLGAMMMNTVQIHTLKFKDNFRNYKRKIEFIVYGIRDERDIKDSKRIQKSD